MWVGVAETWPPELPDSDPFPVRREWTDRVQGEFRALRSQHGTRRAPGS